MQDDRDTGAELHTSKKQRTCGETHVLVSCFDEPDKLIEVNLSLLESFGCRLLSVIKHTEPDATPSGKSYWRSGMTRPMLTTMIKSMTLGELVLSKGVTVSEAMSTFDYEGLNIRKLGHQRKSEHPRLGVGFSKLDHTVAHSVSSLCEQIADAIVCWPRLEVVLDSSLVSPSCGHCGVTATPSRLWVRFADRPKTVEAEGNRFVFSLVCKSPRWFSEGLVALGIIHYRMSLKDADFAKSRDEKSFKALCAEVEADPLGFFFCTRTDAPKKLLKKEISRGERFANEIKQSIIQFAQESDTDTLAVQYARAIVTFVENNMTTSPNCSRVFSGLCGDENGNTPERSALKRSLKSRGISVVRWADERDANVRPLVFPPNWRENANSACYGPSLLLGFDGMR